MSAESGDVKPRKGDMISAPVARYNEADLTGFQNLLGLSIS